jgi:hypothetical protein
VEEPHKGVTSGSKPLTGHGWIGLLLIGVKQTESVPELA